MTAVSVVEILLVAIAAAAFGACFHVAQDALERWDYRRHAND